MKPPARAVKRRQMMKASFAKKLFALASLWALLTFLAGEAAVRIASRTWKPERLIPSADEQLVYELDPQLPEINSFGMRGEEFKPADLQGKYVVAVIGDSHTYSVRAKRAGQAMPQQLERHLNSLRGREAVKVLNLGVPGYNMAQELEVLRVKALRFHPNLVILQYCINDTHVCNHIQPEHKRLNALIHKSALLVFLWKRLLYSRWGKQYLYQWIGKHVPDALLYREGLVGTLNVAAGEEEAHRHHPARTKDRVPPRYHYMLGRDNWERYVHEFAAICRRANIPMLATGPLEAGDREAFAREGFKVYSFFDMINRDEMKQYGYDPKNTATHFDARGSELIGKALAGFIREHYGDQIEAIH